MRTTTKNLRLGGLVLAMGMLAGCGGGGAGDPTDDIYLDLEEFGLVHDQGADAYFDSLGALEEQVWDGAGNADLAELMIRGGLIDQQYIPNPIEMATERDNARLVEVFEAADPETSYRQWDLDARQSAMEAALADVPEAHRSFVNTACMGEGEDYALVDEGQPNARLRRVRDVILPVYMIAQCIETNVDVVVSIVEPEGGRDQFGVWVDMRDLPPNRQTYLVVKEASGGAVICVSRYSPIEGSRRHDTLGGSFNGEGALSLTASLATIILVVHQQGGEDRMGYRGQLMSRVTSITEGVWDATRECL